MILNRKKKESEGQDFTSLDAAVKELAKQTEELLGTSKKTRVNSKKSLAKKPASKPIKSSGHSFDIISSKPTRKVSKGRKLNPQPDTSNTSNALIEAPARELLTENTTEDSIEATEKKDEAATSQSQTTDSQSIIGHQKGSLSKRTNQLQPKIDGKQSDGSSKSSKPTPSGGITFTDESIQDQLIDEENMPATKPPKSSDIQQQMPKSMADSLDTEKKTIAGERLAEDDLTQDTEPKDHTLRKDQQKPTVFDTTEYHPQLHDWSQLGRKSRLPGMILFLLIIILGGVIYFMILG